MPLRHPTPSMVLPLLLLVVVIAPFGGVGMASADPLGGGPTGDRVLASDGGPGDPPPDPSCADGVVLDDGSTEIGWGWVPSVLDGRYVQEFQTSAFPLRSVRELCVCWRRSSIFNTGDDTIDFRVELYRAVPNPDLDGAETFELVPARNPFASVAATATDVPIGTGAFYSVELGNVDLPPGIFYAGVRWDASVEQFFFTCVDTNPETPRVNAYFIEEQAEAWTSVFKTSDPNFQLHHALLVRARPGDEAAVDIPTLGGAGLLVLLVLVVGVGVRRLSATEGPW